MGLLQTRALLGFLDAVGDRAKSDTREDGDDADNDKEFIEGETASIKKASGTTEGDGYLAWLATYAGEA